MIWKKMLERTEKKFRYEMAVSPEQKGIKCEIVDKYAFSEYVKKIAKKKMTIIGFLILLLTFVIVKRWVL